MELGVTPSLLHQGEGFDSGREVWKARSNERRGKQGKMCHQHINSPRVRKRWHCWQSWDLRQEDGKEARTLRGSWIQKSESWKKAQELSSSYPLTLLTLDEGPEAQTPGAACLRLHTYPEDWIRRFLISGQLSFQPSLFPTTPTIPLTKYSLILDLKAEEAAN